MDDITADPSSDAMDTVASMLDVSLHWPSAEMFTGTIPAPLGIPEPVVGTCPASALAIEALQTATMSDDDMNLAWAYPDRLRGVAFEILRLLVSGGGDPLQHWTNELEAEALARIEGTHKAAEAVAEKALQEQQKPPALLLGAPPPLQTLPPAGQAVVAVDQVGLVAPGDATAMGDAKATGDTKSGKDRHVMTWLYQSHLLPKGRAMDAYITAYASHGIPFLSLSYYDWATKACLGGESPSYNSMTHAMADAVAATDAELQAMVVATTPEGGDRMAQHLRWFLLDKFASMWE